MEKQPIHLLNQFGVLSSFSISKKFTEDEINNMAKHLKKGKTNEEMLELLKQKIMNDIIEASKKGKLPGMIVSDTPPPSRINKIDILYKTVELLTQKF